jgi:hypothetical protein
MMAAKTLLMTSAQELRQTCSKLGTRLGDVSTSDPILARDDEIIDGQASREQLQCRYPSTMTDMALLPSTDCAVPGKALVANVHSVACD